MEQRTVLVVGHVARDLIGDTSRLGGAASFSGMAAAGFGYATRIITAAPRAPELESLQQRANVEVIRLPSETLTTFKLEYLPQGRQIHLTARGRALSCQEILKHRPRRSWVTYVAPVIGEVDVGIVTKVGLGVTVVGLQGWLRRADAQGRITPHREPRLGELAGIRAAVFSEEDHPEAESIAAELAQVVPLVVLTRGKRGLTFYDHDGRVDVLAEPAQEKEPTGAGDVFGVVLALSLAHGATHIAASRAGQRAAARVVEGPGLGSLFERPISLQDLIDGNDQVGGGDPTPRVASARAASPVCESPSWAG